MPDRKLQTFPISLAPGGLSASRAEPEPGDLRKLHNFANYRGRWAVRPGTTLFSTLLNLLGTPSAVDVVIHDIADMSGFYWVIGTGQKADTTNCTLLWKVAKDTGIPEAGWSETPAADDAEIVWDGYVAGTPILIPVAGPRTADMRAENRLYIVDYEQSSSAPTKYWRDSDNSMVTVTAQLLDDAAAGTDVFFSNMLEYNSHLWATGYRHDDGSNNVTDDAIIRFSTIGLIQEIEADITNSPGADEWWITDWRSVGDRAQKIVALGKAGGGLVVAKRRAAYLIQGIDRYSWALEQVSGSVGAVGPRAIDWIEEGLCFMWSEVGPVVTDGNKVTKIGDDIKDLVQATQYAQSTAVAVSPDDNLVYFTLDKGTGSVEEWAAFDYERDKWADGSWLLTGTTNIVVNQMKRVSTDTLPGPAAAPTNLVATEVNEDRIDLTWDNGETGIGTTTQIYRVAGAGPADNGDTLEGEVGAGVGSYTDDDLTSRTEYAHAVYHTRNGTESAVATESSVKTGLANPDTVYLSAWATGITVNWTSNEAGEGASTYMTIQRKNITDGGGWEAVTSGSVLSSAETYDDTNSTAGKVYRYRVKLTESTYPDSDYITSSNDIESDISPPVLVSVVHDVTTDGECPVVENMTITARTTNAEVGVDTIKFQYSMEAGTGAPVYTTVNTKPVAGAVTTQIALVPQVTGVGATRYVQCRCYLYEGGIEETAESPKVSVENTTKIDTNCPA